MADRYLTWYLDTLTGTTEQQGPAHYMDKGYSAGHCRIHSRIAPTSGDLKVDIRQDGTSIMTANYAALNKGGNLEEHAEDYSGEPELDEGSVVTLHVIETNGAKGITVQLELDSLDEAGE